MEDKLTKQSSIVTNEIKKYSDLLKCKPMVQQDSKSCKQFIHVELMKLSARSGVDIEPARVKILTEDIFDSFKFDTLEDIQFCFKKGAQGNYEEKIYGRISSEVLFKWMSEHLQIKSIERERTLDRIKNEPITHFEKQLKLMDDVAEIQHKEKEAEIKKEIKETNKLQS